MAGAGAGAGAIAALLRAAHVPPAPRARSIRGLAAARGLPPLVRATAAAIAPSSFCPYLPRLSSARSFSSSTSCSAGASLGGAVSTSPSEQEKQRQQSELIFLGTGTSEGIPRVSCLTNPSKTCTVRPPSSLQQRDVCTKAAEPGNRNRRRNTSILLRHATPSGTANILIDAGKFFYHSALQWFPAYGLRTIDAVIITHSHADAIGGLDCLRDWTNNVQPTIPIYVAERDYEVMKMTHYYLIDTSVVIPGAAVSALQFNIIKEEPFTVHNLEVIPLPVWHGQGYRSLGFRFGRALEEVRKIKPKKTLFTGMMHLMDHEKVNNELAKLMETEGLDIQLSYDGLRVPIFFMAIIAWVGYGCEGLRLGIQLLAGLIPGFQL
ncbi:Os09g0363800 [Oryza sativa Japonica Group]|uniref:Os09g0363800 protein n=1 Tax=Oryza sativa subsp. japonica TaxID=39947 RepID=Q0J2A6_ORYSJ|nr:Os09g0363800 [Oryza sativa Japonica Group]|eukprot:NP_001062995.2 Os09g0363800 [Oryza sativa Japonica Group]